MDVRIGCLVPIDGSIYPVENDSKLTPDFSQVQEKVTH